MTATCISCGHTEREAGKIGVDGLCDLCYRAQRDEKDRELSRLLVEDARKDGGRPSGMSWRAVIWFLTSNTRVFQSRRRE